MQLPRRVPWASIAELDQVCTWIYTDETDYSAKELAVHRLSAWRAITPLPHALDSILAFLTVILQDNNVGSSSTCSYSLRQSYATAVIRLVNGFVDPLQSGAYARSIASIATQLGLPAWLVELRHAATHEDLPSLEVLREAARESLDWLLHNYFIPVLNPSSADQSLVPPMRPVSPLLKQYKALSKVVTRDASLKSKYLPEITKVFRDIERWISEAKVAANVNSDAFGWGEVDNTEDRDGSSYLDAKERLALDGLCDGLLEKGYLVPLSKRKRALAKDSFTPPKLVLSLWTPLLSDIQTLHPAFPQILVSRILLRLLSNPTAQQDGSTQTRDSSYEMCLASWVIFLLQTFSSADDDPETEYEVLNERSVIIFLMTDLGLMENTADCIAAKTLLKELCKNNPKLAEACSLVANKSVPSAVWNEGDLSVMIDRLDELLVKSEGSSGGAEGHSTPPTTMSAAATMALPVGWRHVDAKSGWRPSPIGVFVPCE